MRLEQEPLGRDSGWGLLNESGGWLAISCSPSAPLQVLVTKNCSLELMFLIEGGERRQQESGLGIWPVSGLSSQAWVVRSRCPPRCPNIWNGSHTGKEKLWNPLFSDRFSLRLGADRFML